MGGCFPALKRRCRARSPASERDFPAPHTPSPPYSSCSTRRAGSARRPVPPPRRGQCLRSPHAHPPSSPCPGPGGAAAASFCASAGAATTPGAVQPRPPGREGGRGAQGRRRGVGSGPGRGVGAPPPRRVDAKRCPAGRSRAAVAGPSQQERKAGGGPTARRPPARQHHEGGGGR